MPLQMSHKFTDLTPLLLPAGYHSSSASHNGLRQLNWGLHLWNKSTAQTSAKVDLTSYGSKP
jgi:hypothetical protein